jgi:hypothetical protein
LRSLLLLLSGQARNLPAPGLPLEPQERGCRHFRRPSRWRGVAAAGACRLQFARNRWASARLAEPEPEPQRPLPWAWPRRYLWSGGAADHAAGWSRWTLLPLPAPPWAR